MKLHGKKIEECNVEYVVIPRPSGDIAFKCTAVLDFSKFAELCPPPKPPMKMVKGGAHMPNFNDPGYNKALENQGQLKYYFTILESLKSTKGLEWETVDPNNPKTWNKLEDELKSSGFNEFEINRIVRGVLRANSLDERMLEEARQNFMKVLEEEKESSSQEAEMATS